MDMTVYVSTEAKRKIHVGDLSRVPNRHWIVPALKRKEKLILVPRKTYSVVEVQLHQFLLSGLDASEYSASKLDHLPPKNVTAVPI
jgi:hypothetical protein